MTHSLAICLYPAARVWSINERLHWAERAELVRTWRYQTEIEAKIVTRAIPRSVIPLPPPVRVHVNLIFKDRRRRDAHNYSGTVCKAIVDGLVDAGLVADDSTEYLSLDDPTIIQGTRSEVVVTISWEQP